MHFLGNLAEEVLEEDDQLRQNLRNDLGGLPAVPKQSAGKDKAPFFSNCQGCRTPATRTALPPGYSRCGQSQQPQAFLLVIPNSG